MPALVVGALLAGVIGPSIAAGALAFSWGAFASSLVLGGLSRALQKTPEQPSGSGAAVSSSGRLVTIRQPVAPWQIVVGQARVGGIMTFINVTSGGGGTNNRLDMIITLAGHVCQEIGDIYFDDEIVPLDGTYPNGGGGVSTGKYAGKVAIHKSLGDEAGQPFGATDSSGSGLVAESDGKWTDAHRQTGRTKIWVRLIADPDTFPNGVPNITAVVKGRKIYDTRSATTAYSNNPALWVSHYLTDPTYGMGATYADEIDDADLVAAANVCDEAVSLDAGGTETRYTVNGTFLVSETPKDIIEKLLNGMAGTAVAAGEKWHIHAGAYEAPTLTFDEGDLAGAISVQSLVSRRENANGVKGIFTDPNSSWQPTDFPPIDGAAYLAEDSDERVWRDIDLTAFVTSGTQAQRLAKIELLRTRQGLTCSARFKLTAWQAMTGRTIALSNTKFGWSAKAFDVQSSRFVIGDDATLNVELALRETASAVYDWSTSEEQAVAAAPNTNLPNPFTVAPPTDLAFDEAAYQLKGEGNLSWTAAADAYVIDYQPEYKAAADAGWTVLSPVNGTSKRITGLPPDTYNFRVKARNALGVSSAYTSTLVVAIAPAQVPLVSGLELFNGGVSTTFTGRDAKFAWRARSQQNTPEFGSETLGASEGRVDPYFKDYKVVIESTDGTIRRTEFVPGTQYTYTLEKNVEDGSGTPVRSFRIKVWQRGQQNQLSPIPAQLLVSNPVPALPSGVILRASFKYIFLQHTPAADPDYKGILVYVSTSTGFTPGDANLAYTGPDRLIVIDADPGTDYFVRYAPFDEFGETGINVSGELAISTAQIATADIEAGAITADSAIIADAAIQTAMIDDLQVTTLKIADQAVTIPVSSYAASNLGVVGISGDVNQVLSLSITSLGNPILLLGALNAALTSGSANGYIAIYRGSVPTGFLAGALWSAGNGIGMSVAGIETPGAGTYTYYLVVGGFYPGTVNLTNLSLVAMEVKK